MTGLAPACPELVVIGCSAGGLKALQTLLAGLHGGHLPPLVICCHTASREVDILCDLLARHTPLSVTEAAERQPIISGNVYVAPSGYHLLIEQDRHFALNVDPKVNFSRPSIDVLFESAAMAYRNNTLGVILTGANQDGARGLKRIAAMGGTTIVQAPSSAEVAAMPQAALDLVRPNFELDLEAIATLISQLCRI